MFTDEVIITVESGKGGAGLVSFLHEKYREFGGPDGGDGGKGGDVIIRTRKNLRSLDYAKMKKNFKAKPGQNGQKRNKSGAKGKDEIIEVPIGTMIKRADDDTLLVDLTENNQEYLAAKGGKGGKGNAQFVSSVNQAPRYAQPGLPGEKYILKLELKLIADVGLVGFPNAGKSTLLAAMTKANPKIAPYPFTTLYPNLGVVHMDYHHSFIIADIPGLIEGAHQGVGLGIRFLKHIERTKIIVFVLDVSEGEVHLQYNKLMDEMQSYSAELLSKKRIVLLNKMDTIEPDSHPSFLETVKETLPEDLPLFLTSGATHLGLKPLQNSLYQLINQE